MPREYTKTQLYADDMDEKLRRLMAHATQVGDMSSTSDDERLRWMATALLIQESRVYVRQMMHPETRDETAV